MHAIRHAMKKQKGINWQFTTDDDRVKLKTLYSVIELKD